MWIKVGKQLGLCALDILGHNSLWYDLGCIGDNHSPLYGILMVNVDVNLASKLYFKLHNDVASKISPAVAIRAWTPFGGRLIVTHDRAINLVCHI